MMEIQTLVQKHGRVIFQGKQYVLVNPIYRCGYWEHGAAWFIGDAICPAEGTDHHGRYSIYEICWVPQQDWLDSDRKDESWACDWEAPNHVRPSDRYYDLAANYAGFRDV